jgi:queuine tRNA-ribosyltransferase
MAVFEIIKTSRFSKARAGRLHTRHGAIDTPVFMPVGTQATVKSLTPQQIADCGTQILLGNTYHLALRPGAETVVALGGLHAFMGWKGPILTDSGGYQVFSLASRRKLTEAGVTFRSHIDGLLHQFTPESVVDIQLALNSDIQMPLDICTPYPADHRQAESDMQATTRWLHRAAARWKARHDGQHLFGIVQGGMYADLRARHVAELAEMNLPGYAVGGVSVGEPKSLMHELICQTGPMLPGEKPRYLMGIGLPEDFDVAVRHGFDMFDCVAPTRLARHGDVFTSQGRIKIKNAQYATDPSPLDPQCDCYTCQHFSKGYLRHLFMAKEMLVMTLLTLHNVTYLVRYVDAMREAIVDDRL